MFGFRHLSTALALSAALGSFAVANAQAQEQETVRIGLSSHGLLFMPALAAEAMSYFEDAGIDGENVKLGGANKVYSALLGGEIDVSVSSSVSVLRARAGGANLMMIGTAMNQHGSNIVASREWAEAHGITPESTYEERLAALDGITISTASVGGGSDQLVRLLAEEAGLDPDRDMTLTVLGVGDTTLAAFANRRVDAITHSSPTAVKAIRDHDGMMLFHLTAGAVPAYDGFPYLVYTVRQDWVEEHPDLAIKFLQVMQRTHRALQDPELSVEIMNAVHEKYHANIDDDLYEAAWQDYITAFPKGVDITAGMVDRVVVLARKFFESAEPIDQETVKSAWTNDYVEKAAASRTQKADATTQ